VKRHPELVDGLVFSATSSSFVPGLRGQIFFTGPMMALAGSTRLGSIVARTPLAGVSKIIPSRSGRPSSMQAWAAAEMARHDTRILVEAGSAIGLFNSTRWIGDVDVPTSMVITTKDHSVRPSAQLDLALAIEGAQLHRLDEGHVAPVSDDFGVVITEACRAVAARIESGGQLRTS